MKRWFAAAALVVAACSPARTALTDTQKGAIADSVHAAQRAFFAAIPKMNPDTFMTYVGARVAWLEMGSMIDHDSLGRTIRNNYGMTRSITLNGGEPQITVLGPDGASLSMKFDEVFTDTAGVAHQFHGAWTAVYQHEGAAWKIVQSHESIPATEAAPAPVAASRHR
jgi:hypothetical protein